MGQSATAVKVTELIIEPVKNAGYELWSVRFVKEGASWYLRIFIDKDGGVGIDDCTAVSHLIDPIIDAADPVSVPYFLEVCSPGLERELTDPGHFEKYIGNEVKVKLIRPQNGIKEFAGKLLSYDGGVTVLCDGKEKRFEKSEISGVRLDDAFN